MSKKATTEEFVAKAQLKHGNVYDYSKTIYLGAYSKVIITCPIHGDFQPRANLHTSGRGCQKCGWKKLGDGKSKDLQHFIEKAVKVHGNKYDYSESVYTKMQEDITIRCPTHGHFTQNANSHLMGRGCPQCAIESQKAKLRSNIDEFVEKAIKVHGDKYDYSKVVYVNAHTKIIIICPEHNEFEQTPHNHLIGHDCARCKDSKGAKMVERWLKDNEIKFTREFCFPDCKYLIPLPFDFYLPEMNLLIEYDGEQHFRVVDFFNGEEGFIERQRNDAIKNEYAAKNNIPLLRIQHDLDAQEIANALTQFIMEN